MIEDLYSIYRDCSCRVTTDSRNISGGELFFALKGENFDGNLFAIKALEAGAARAVVNEDAALPEDGRLIRVPDTQVALSELAAFHRNHVLGENHLPVIGLTGTNGKTTTKELVRAVLSRKYNVCATEGNLNNDIGVPLSILKIRPDTEIAIIEMGASHPDDIEKLVRVSQPDYGLITNVGKAHLLGFGSFDGVKRAKGALYRWLGSHRGSLIFLNEDDAVLREMASSQACHQYGYGIGYNGAEVLASSVEEPFLRIKLHNGAVVRTNLVGSYNATNVMAALAIGEYFGVPESEAVAAIEAFEPKNKRSQMQKTSKNTLIVDAYNANPSSMAAALDNFDAVSSDGKVAMLGDMRELGEDSLKEHCAVLKRLACMGVRCFLVGDEFRKAAEAVGDFGFSYFATSGQLASFLEDNPVAGSMILLKGSRGIEMEKVLPSL